MSGSFWSRKLNGPGPQTQSPGPAQVPMQSPQGAWWQPQPQPQAQPGYFQGQPTQDPALQGLAVQQYQPQMTEEQQLRQQQGYAKRAPEWVKRQPTDRCPECDGVNYAQLGGGENYGGTVHGVVFKRCFDCGYSNKGVRNALSGVPSSGAVVGAARQTVAGGRGGVSHFQPKNIFAKVTL